MDIKTLILQILNENDSIVSIMDQKQITVLELLTKGGFMMLPILLLFIIIVYCLLSIVYRLWLISITVYCVSFIIIFIVV